MQTTARGLGQARAMRRNPTATERRLWRLLRDRRLEGLKFRRQVQIGPFIADFACLAHKLIVEADGPVHDATEDLARDGWLQTQGFRVLRFSNGTIIDRPHVFIAAILAATGQG
jgi:very-short-patch-repair endonuclease